MKWTKKKQPKPQEQRVITKFLWWPYTYEQTTYWLEKLKVRQIYSFNYKQMKGKWKTIMPEEEFKKEYEIKESYDPLYQWD